MFLEIYFIPLIYINSYFKCTEKITYLKKSMLGIYLKSEISFEMRTIACIILFY